MKKYIQGSIAFLIFAIGVNILQTSCEKDANASSNELNGLIQLNKILFSTYHTVPNYTYTQIYISDYEGMNVKKVNISLPSGHEMLGVESRLSPDGKSVFFIAVNSGLQSVWKCNVDGSNPIKILDADLPGDNIRVEDVH